jgi:hypothetical protein
VIEVARTMARVQRAYQYLLSFEWAECEFLASPEGGIDKHVMVARSLERALRRWAVMLQPGASRT